MQHYGSTEIIDSKEIIEGYITLNAKETKAGDTLKLTITAQDKISYQSDITAVEESGIIETKEESEYAIFPNPTTGEITIKGKEGKINIKIFNCPGQLVFSSEVDSNTPFSIQQKSGRYFLYIENDKSTHSLLIRN